MRPDIWEGSSLKPQNINVQSDGGDLWDGPTVGPRPTRSTSFYIQQMANSYKSCDSMFSTAWKVLLGIAGIVLLICALYLFFDFAWSTRQKCSDGDLAACVEYNWILQNGK